VRRVGPFRLHSYQSSVEYKVIALRECILDQELIECDNPAKAVTYWQKHIQDACYFNPDCECLVALFLNTRLRIKGHHIISIGLLNQLLAHPREVFRCAIMAAAYSVVLMHNHPSGDPTPSLEDIQTTRDMVRAGALLRIAMHDHVIVGDNSYASLKDLGFLSD
jgi:DNA repair protein RadC